MITHLKLQHGHTDSHQLVGDLGTNEVKIDARVVFELAQQHESSSSAHLVVCEASADNDRLQGDSMLEYAEAELAREGEETWSHVCGGLCESAAAATVLLGMLASSLVGNHRTCGCSVVKTVDVVMCKDGEESSESESRVKYGRCRHIKAEPVK